MGFRYGSVVPGEAVSYTELEFAAAGAVGLPRLVFLLDEPAAAAAAGLLGWCCRRMWGERWHEELTGIRYLLRTPKLWQLVVMGALVVTSYGI